MKYTKFYIVSGFAILISIFVILFTWLKFVDLTFAEKISKEVMIASISMIGAIVGGVVSGVLTLAGVHLSISNERKEKLKENFPIRKRSADKVMGELFGLSGLMSIVSELFEPNPQFRYEFIAESLKQLEEQEERILDLSMNVDGYFFSCVSEVLINCQHIRLSLSVLQTTDDIGSINYINNDVPKMVNEVRKIVSELEKYAAKMNEDVF